MFKFFIMNNTKTETKKSQPESKEDFYKIAKSQTCAKNDVSNKMQKPVEKQFQYWDLSGGLLGI